MSEGYYHVRITKRNGKNAYEIDLNKSQLLEKIVAPIKEGKEFMCSHSLISRSDIEKVLITNSAQHSKDMKWAKVESLIFRSMGENGEVAHPFEYYVVYKGKDVTSKFLDFFPIQTHNASEVQRRNSVTSEFFSGGPFTIDEKLCFVLMPFDEEYRSVHEEIIKPVAFSLGLNAKRADDIFEPRSIMQGIWEHINSAKVVIADLSGRNPNVFYEVGLSHALQKKVVLLARSTKDVPFDLRHLRCIIYEDSFAGKKILEVKLSQMIKNILQDK
ncbi:hypothetical protein [Candidatus Nitrososphaera sp. FF02]|uniref:hypothetical protein n=1 Tax=Candidatus Nitrososphaera sp. FF02 TaxID=3398226 RepID=UPI0039E97290